MVGGSGLAGLAGWVGSAGYLDGPRYFGYFLGLGVFWL